MHKETIDTKFKNTFNVSQYLLLLSQQTIETKYSLHMFFTTYLISRVHFTLNTSRFEQATFYMLNSHMWLLASILENTVLENAFFLP